MKGAIVGLSCCLGIAGFTNYYKDLVPKVVEKPFRVEVPVREKSLKVLLNDIPKEFGVPPVVAWAIAKRESNFQQDATRYEPGQLERAKKACKTSNSDYLRQCSSSHGMLQVMGYHAPQYGLTWADLYNRETNVRVGMQILSDCMKRYQNKTKDQQLYWSLACYNGSEKYAREVVSEIGNILIEKYL